MWSVPMVACITSGLLAWSDVGYVYGFDNIFLKWVHMNWTQPQEDLFAQCFSTFHHTTIHPGYCVRYTGTLCSSNIHGLKTVYISSFNQQSHIEKKLENALNVITSSRQLSKRCKPYVLPIVCHFLFPYCNDMASDPEPRPLCYEECDLLRTDICKDEYNAAREQLEHVLFPNCSMLPRKESKEGKNCIPLRLPFTRGVRFREQKGKRNCEAHTHVKHFPLLVISPETMADGTLKQHLGWSKSGHGYLTDGTLKQPLGWSKSGHG